MNTDCYIEIPSDKLRDAIKLAYAMSAPQGLGFLHYKDGGLDEATVDAIIDREKRGTIAASMDYVNGRSCKFTVYRDGTYDEPGKRLFVNPSWYDHGDLALEDLLTELGVEDAAGKMASARAAAKAENAKWERENAASRS